MAAAFCAQKVCACVLAQKASVCYDEVAPRRRNLRAANYDERVILYEDESCMEGSRFLTLQEFDWRKSLETANFDS